MKHSSGEPGDHHADAGYFAGAPELDLPDDPGFISESPRVNADVLYRHNLSQMKFLNSRPGADEQRFREKCDVPFEI
jgi:hypothetical protein